MRKTSFFEQNVRAFVTFIAMEKNEDIDIYLWVVIKNAFRWVAVATSAPAFLVVIFKSLRNRMVKYKSYIWLVNAVNKGI